MINALRDKYRLKVLLKALDMAKSSYCYQENAISGPDKYKDLRVYIKDIFSKVNARYGYRRIYLVLKKSGKTVSEKVVRWIMKKEHLIVPSVKKKEYSTYIGEISPEVENVINRDFNADKPNEKWLTDLTDEFHISAGKVYLSPMTDCFDGLAVAWTISTSPDANLANAMLEEAILTLNENEHPIVHLDRGCHYRWPGWIERMTKADLTWQGVSLEAFICELDAYIKWYNEERIKISLGVMSSVEYRSSLGLVA